MKESIKKISIAQIKAARALLGWSQDELSARSGVSMPTIGRIEAAGGDIGGRASTAEKLVAALEAGGIIFIEADGDGAGVRLRRAN